MTTDDGSINSFSWTLPKESRLASNAPLNKLEPMAFPNVRPSSVSKVKSASYGPRVRFWPLPETEYVQVPVSRGNSNEKVRVSPGPNEVMEVRGWTFVPLSVVMYAERPPTGMADSLVISMVTNTTSSSSSSISIFTEVRRASSEEVRALCSSLMCSPVGHSTKSYFNSTQP